MTEVTRQPCFLPRLLRLRDAPFYLGMDRNRFNAEVRPQVTEIRIGEQGIERIGRDGGKSFIGWGKDGERTIGAQCLDQVGGLQRLRNQRAVGDQGDVVSFA